MSYNTERGRNYIFYVTEMEEAPAKGHFRKMDAGREIADHIAQGIDNVYVDKYTRYHGEVLHANSVGIIFPTHMWGVSLAVYAFIKNLKVSPGTYVYAISVGESISAGVEATFDRRLGFVESFMKMFKSKGFGGEENIFMRCIDIKRDYETTEECIRGEKNDIVRLGHIMEGLLFYSIADIKKAKLSDKVCIKEEPVKMVVASRTVSQYKGFANLYLDEYVLEGVRLCQVM